MKNNNLKSIIYLVCIAALSVCLIASGLVHYRSAKNKMLLASDNANLQLELENKQSMLSDTLNELGVAKSKLTTTQENLKEETEKTANLTDELAMLQAAIDDVVENLEVANTTINDLKDKEYQVKYIGNYKLTHYCPGFHGEPCGTGDGLTATGTKVTPGRTIAVDPRVIPYGTKVYIEGYGWRVAEDCGGSVKGNHIDVAMSTHNEAIANGVNYGDVWILVED